jgi:hypothetical protein
MKIVGCDLHTRYQQIAMLDAETGELIGLHPAFTMVSDWPACRWKFRRRRGRSILGRSPSPCGRR